MSSTEDFAPAFSETLNFYISDAEDGICRVPRQKLVEIQQQLRAVDALTSSTASGEDGWREAIAEIAAERQRQIDVEGWTPEHDDEHAKGEITAAAFGYLQSVMSKIGLPRFTIHDAPNFWPWDRKWFKPSTPRRDLVKAGALIVAEIERLDRLSSSKEDGNA